MKRIAVTGIGIVAPSGTGKRPFWANIKNGRSFVRPITRFDASKYPSHIAGQIEDLDAYSHLSERLLKKIDTFSHLALIASEQALQDAGIDVQKENPNNIGIFMGNAIGGWLYAETELRDLYMEGREGVSPYMASAWFPAAPQGQVSIYYGIKGFSKTVVSDRASSLMAIGYAKKTLEKERLDFILAGGMEAPVTPYALLCCNSYGALSANNANPQAAYRPFDEKRDGFVIGEGAGIMIMESEERARKRGAHISAYVSGYGATCDGIDRIKADISGRQLARAIKIALEGAGIKPQDIDYICLDGAATIDGDTSELNAIKDVFAGKATTIPVSAPKTMLGNLLGASGAVDIIITILAMENRMVPPMINLDNPVKGADLNFIRDKGVAREINNALVISRGRGGINSALILRKT